MFIKQLKKERKKKKVVEPVGLELMISLMADGHASSEPREPEQSLQKIMASDKTMNYW